MMTRGSSTFLSYPLQKIRMLILFTSILISQMIYSHGGVSYASYLAKKAIEEWYFAEMNVTR